MAYFFTVLADLVRSGGDGTPAQVAAAPHGRPWRGSGQAAGAGRAERPGAVPCAARDVPPAAIPPPAGTLVDPGDPVVAVPPSVVVPPTAAAPPYSPYIAGVILDYGRELGAGSAGWGYVTQALRLWATSRLGETPFVGLLHTARRQFRGGALPCDAMPSFSRSSRSY
jgi:hypothetical protein